LFHFVSILFQFCFNFVSFCFSFVSDSFQLCLNLFQFCFNFVSFCFSFVSVLFQFCFVLFRSRLILFRFLSFSAPTAAVLAAVEAQHKTAAPESTNLVESRLHDWQNRLQKEQMTVMEDLVGTSAADFEPLNIQDPRRYFNAAAAADTSADTSADKSAQQSAADCPPERAARSRHSTYKSELASLQWSEVQNPVVAPGLAQRILNDITHQVRWARSCLTECSLNVH
jgi:hypothetical protein